MKLTYNALCLITFLCITHAASAMEQMAAAHIDFQTQVIIEGLSQLLEKHKSHPNAQDLNGNTILHTAVLLKNSIAVKAIVSMGVDVNVKNKQGDTPLHLAAALGDSEIIYILLGDAKTRADAAIKNNQGQLPEDVASKHGHHKLHGFLMVMSGSLLKDKEDEGK